MSRPVLFFLHALGSSRREWAGVVEALGRRFECVALDTPGFGGTPRLTTSGVDALVDWFEGEVAHRTPPRWLVVGHSMGGKIASLAAARARDGASGLAGLEGVVLVAGSPPCPEPMDESRREQMLAWFEGSGPTRAQAETFVDTNTHVRLPEPLRAMAVDDVMRSDAQAWRDWLEHGTREHRQAMAGELRVPALILAGAEDGDLGERAQRALNGPHYTTATIDVVPDAAHLIPLEQPAWLAKRIGEWADGLPANVLSPEFVTLLNSTRVSSRMRAAVLERSAQPSRVGLEALSQAQLDVLIALTSRVLPGVDANDLALRVAHAIASGRGDGWRFADLPSDADAWAWGLRLLDEVAGGFAQLTVDAQDDLLRLVQQRRLRHPEIDESGRTRLAHWFEDVCSLLARTWMSLPSTWDTIGFDGFAVGGQGARSTGYAHVQADVLDEWQLRR